ncbi:ABATE domain-containing protein [Nocardia sp. XZ_19_385]|uniref:CGNR zinc finger domain-containing protein n=1 Tax=Nocardia sp. XZ_19_385 TaxID=2769488 RepID=UPI00188E3A9F|nr:CGNR zinc finger domain-containing protein [Nocardia sp. XZ_19_385]
MTELEPLIGEPLPLDLVNTRPVGTDLLRTPEQLGRWLSLQADRLPEASLRPTRADLDAVQGVREHLSAVLDALLDDRRPPAPALRGLDAAISAAPAVRRLAWTRETLSATVVREGNSSARLAAALADAAVDLLTGPSISRLKRCAADDCVMLFLPAHPRRQWCSPERCGNRARVARYYQRHKAATD